MKKAVKSPQKSEADALKEASVAYRISPVDDFYPLRTREDQGWADFRDQCRRQMKRPLEIRIKYGFSRPIKQGAKEPRWHAFKTMAEYRAWCEKNLPGYLGFKRPSK